VNDIELLCIPKVIRGVDQLDRELGALFIQGILTYRPDKRGRICYGPKNKLLLQCESGIAVDIFSTLETNWGMALFVRTGPKEWNIRAMQRFQELGMRGHAYGGVTDEEGNEVDCPDEQSVFRLLAWSFTTPEERG